MSPPDPSKIVASGKAEAPRSQEAVGKLISTNFGARYEGTFFQSFQERAQQSLTQDMSFADRFWFATHTLHRDPRSSKILLFDPKSTTSQFAGDQCYLTRLHQRRHVAFYIGICAADPSMVEVIPNFRQEKAPLSEEAGEGDDKEVAVNTSRIARLPPSTYRLDPSNAPYRMHLAQLPEAVRRLRRCAQGKGPYINPWTGVTFRNWRPATTSSNRLLKPEHPQHFTGYQATVEIQRAIQERSAQTGMEMDFVGLQPRLGDFKLIIHRTSSETTESRSPAGYPQHVQPQLCVGLPGSSASILRQVIVQLKIDGVDRAKNTPLSKVAIARGQGPKRRHYFSAFDRSDFFLYLFSFSERPDPPSQLFFFIPEREIPDLFYESHETEEIFERFSHHYRIPMDSENRWVWSMLQIIIENPQPRRAGFRPVRSAPVSDLAQEKPSAVTAKPDTNDHTRTNDEMERSGRGSYKDIMTHNHRPFYYTIMKECAKRMSGLLVVLATDHPMGDFGFCRLQWTQKQRDDFLNVGLPPMTINDLPAHKPLVPIYYYTKDSEYSSDGPSLTSPQFRRLNSCGNHRLVIWNLWGSDKTDHLRSLVMDPSEDIRPTEAQRQLMASNLTVNKKEDFTDRTPTISCFLDNGLLAAEYAVGNRGPLAYGGNDMGEIWKLLDQFTKPLKEVYHPQNHARDPAKYRCPLWKVHERLVEEDIDRKISL